MKCKCGSDVVITKDNIQIFNYAFVIICDNCKRAYTESDFNEKELNNVYCNKNA